MTAFLPAPHPRRPARRAGPGQPRPDPRCRRAPLVDEHLDRWADRLGWAEGQIGAAQDAAQLIATFPPEHVGPQVLQVAQHLGLEHAQVTSAVLDAVSRDADAPGRPAARDRRADLDHGQEAAIPPAAAPTAAQLAQAGYPAPLTIGARSTAAAPATPYQRAPSRPRRHASRSPAFEPGSKAAPAGYGFMRAGVVALARPSHPFRKRHRLPLGTRLGAGRST